MLIVLAHGILRFDELNVLLGRDIGPRYFDGIGDFLRQHGFTVDEPAVNFCGSLEERAKDLKARFDKFPPGEQFHIIAHSMGGLDARKMLFDHPEMARRVRCLTTIGTPHLGTSSADLGFSLGAEHLIALSKVIDLAGFRDLTTTACARFNETVREREVANGVRYRAVAATESVLRTTLLLAVTANQLAAEGQSSDGIVPQSSQHWDGATKAVERLYFPIPADHLNEVGVWDPAEGLPLVFENRVKNFYLELARTA